MNPRPLHPDLPRRPDRTSEREEPRHGDTTIRTFHEVPMHSPGVTRVIALLSRPGDHPVVSISYLYEIGTKRRARYLIRAGDAPIVLEAIQRAKNGKLARLELVGEIGPTTGKKLGIAAIRNPGQDQGGVLLGWRSAAGDWEGRPTTIFGAEIDALECAINALVLADRAA